MFHKIKKASPPALSQREGGCRLKIKCHRDGWQTSEVWFSARGGISSWWAYQRSPEP